MPLGSTTFWAAIIPQESVNLVVNCSFERGTAGWGTLQAGTIGTTSAFQTFGAWAGSIAPTSNGTAGAIGPTFTANTGTTYYFSAYVRGVNGIPYRLAVGDSNGVNFVGSTTFTGGGSWQRYVGSWAEASGATRRVVLTKNSSADTNAFYVDGVQVEPNCYTTFIDADGDSGTWVGAPHQSASFRSGQNRTGGSVVALADLGFTPNDMPGVGMPPLQNSFQSYAILDGAEYQRTRAAERSFTLTSYMAGTSQQHLHQLRRQVINALKIDLVTPQQPTRFWYTGAGGTVQLDAVLDGGLELGEFNGFEETAGVKFLAFDPYWESTTQQGTALASFTPIGSTNFIVARDPLGRWGTLGINGTTTNDQVQSLESYNGTLFLGGAFGSVAGTAARFIAQYDQINNRFGTLTGGTLSSNVFALKYAPWGSLFIGGQFTLAGGTNSQGIAQWNGAYGSLGPGSANSAVSVIALDPFIAPNGIIFGGQFTTVGGTASGRTGFWSPTGGFGTLSGGTVDNQVFGLAVTAQGTIYVGGQFTKAGGTTAPNIAQWNPNGSWGTLTGGTVAAAVEWLAIGPDAALYVFGDFHTINGGSANLSAKYNGVSFTAMGSGLFAPGIGDNVQQAAIRSDGVIYAVGTFNTANGMRIPQNLAQWNGYTWLSMDFVTPQSVGINVVHLSSNGTLYIGGIFSGQGTAAAVAQVVNTGMANAYPTIVFRNTGSGTARVFQVLNTLTNDNLWFNLSLATGETATLELAPGNKSFTSDFTGNVITSILPGSNLSSFRLAPGTNYISSYAETSSVQTSIYWTPQHWSADAGTI